MKTSSGRFFARLWGMLKNPLRTLIATILHCGFFIALCAKSIAVSPQPMINTRLPVNSKESLYSDEWIIWPLNLGNILVVSAGEEGRNRSGTYGVLCRPEQIATTSNFSVLMIWLSGLVYCTSYPQASPSLLLWLASFTEMTWQQNWMCLFKPNWSAYDSK